MFQADYHLKELSMGEYEQPVMGMKSCFDYLEAEDSKYTWNAREWFLIKDAEVCVSENSVLVPSVKMGVEAREQIVTEHGLIDVAMTRKDHPLVKYADTFSRNFDLIAERKSVIFHLRECAKATVLAKFLIDSQVALDNCWFQLADDKQEVCPMEVPQLWNDRHYSQIQVKDGAIVGGEKGIGHHMRGVYGGVQFGLDKVDVAKTTPSAVAKPVVKLTGATTRIAPRPGMLKTALTVPVKSMAKSTAGIVMAPSGRVSYAPISSMMSLAAQATEPLAAEGWSSVASLKRPPRAQGVDLNLDTFNLSNIKRVQLRGNELQYLESCTSMGQEFWGCLEKGYGFKNEDHALLQAIFNRNLSDRRAEGGRFIPPDNSPEYVNKLRKLVTNEQVLHQQRQEHFCSENFATGDPGELFPTSWTSTFELARGETKVKVSEAGPKGSLLQRRPDYEAESQMFQEVLKSTAPVFDNSAEDGSRFRIYRLGSIEVRTIQEDVGVEEIVAVYSIRSSAKAVATGNKDVLLQEAEKIAKVTEYVERTAGTRHAGKDSRGYFVMLETREGNVISTEMGEDGRVTWEENPVDVEDRISLAKVLRTADCQASRNTVRDLKTHMEQEARRASSTPDPSKCKTYARDTFIRARSHLSEGGNIARQL
mmetsp:Transcript_33795/g.63069  ORF Transcript_33795/g.63069 Transcript_33795/m.63069 type:complete len:649 (-) Transcript_33795:59-2005(-)